jgi:hypothetical protein
MRVTLNGVSMWTTECNDIEGWVRTFRFIDGKWAARRVNGSVEMVTDVKYGVVRCYPNTKNKLKWPANGPVFI